MPTETKKKPQTKKADKPEKEDKANLEAAVADAGPLIEEGLPESFGGTTGVLDQGGPEIVVSEIVEDNEPVVVVEQKRIELAGTADLVTNQSGQVLIFGPFDEYRIVNTDFGDYGVTMGCVLGFQIRDFFNKKESRVEKQPFPVYWNAETGKRVIGSGIDPKDHRKPKARA